MNLRRASTNALALVLLAGCIAFATAPASAQSNRQNCYWDSASGRLRCDNAVPGGPPASGGGGGSSEGRPLGRWFVWINDIVPDPSNPCPADPATGQVPQRRYLQFFPAGNPAGTRTVDSWCPPTDLPIPPPPPTPAELRGLAQAPAPTVNLSPDGRGVTGLATRLWADPPAPVVVGPLALRGWSVTGRADPTLWEWSMGQMAGTRNPDPHLSSTNPGTEANPAVTYTYETKGDYTVTMTVTYGGSFTVVGPYGVTVNAGIGAISVSNSRSYNVIEVRSARD